MTSILSEGIGYVILLGVGLVMAVSVTLLVRVEHKWLGTRKTFEWFYTAGRNVKTGLISGFSSLCLDLGGYSFAILYCGISVRH